MKIKELRKLFLEKGDVVGGVEKTFGNYNNEGTLIEGSIPTFTTEFCEIGNYNEVVYFTFVIYSDSYNKKLFDLLRAFSNFQIYDFKDFKKNLYSKEDFNLDEFEKEIKKEKYFQINFNYSIVDDSNQYLFEQYSEIKDILVKNGLDVVNQLEIDKEIKKEAKLLEILKKNKTLQTVLKRVDELGLKNWYVGAGSINQTVWNVLCGFEQEYGIEDYDLVYYDAEDISYEGENFYIQKGKELFKDISSIVEIRNQARVHLWFEKHFGYKIKPHKSVEDSIKAWPTISSCIGVRYDKANDVYKIYAPYGLDDIFNLVVRPNKQLITKEVYDKKVRKWIKKWPNLKIIQWEENLKADGE